MFELFKTIKKIGSMIKEINEINEKINRIERVIDFHLEMVHGVKKSETRKIEVKAE